jgi:O-antigen/teichoic acid export membrane protein
VSFFADFVLTTGSAILAIGVIGLIAGLPAVAATQGAQLLFAPFAALVSGARIILLPLLGAAALRPLIALRRIVGQASLALYGLAALWGGLVLLMPDTLGRAFLGPTWAAAEPLVPWIALYWVIRTGGLPALDGLRALGGGRPLIAVRGVTGVLILLSAVVGSSLGGALGAAIGLSIVLLVAVVLWCAVFIRVTRPRLS